MARYTLTLGLADLRKLTKVAKKNPNKEVTFDFEVKYKAYDEVKDEK